MPGTTRYSATFDRPYQEEDRAAKPEVVNGARRSRSQSWQAHVGMGPHGSFSSVGLDRPMSRSSSTDAGDGVKVEHIPTRTVSKTVVKTHNNPFQFVKVGNCPLYKKAEEQIKKTKEVKKPEVLKEEEEWQTNLDSWKSRRRKMSEDVFRRQEEIRQFEQEEQCKPTTDKKIKTFSEMVESRAHRGRSLSLCLISNPLEMQAWGSENKNNSSHPYSEGSEENSAVNSEDEGASDKTNFQKNLWTDCTNGNGIRAIKNGSANHCRNKINETSYTDSGLESISSSHRTGDTPDSCSDFSQDSGSSIDCDSPRVSGMLSHSVNLLEDFNSKESPKKDFHDPFHEVKMSTPNGDCKKNEEKSSTSATCDISNKEHVSENGLGHSIESENEVFVDDFEELHANSKIFQLPNPEKVTVHPAANSEAPETPEVTADIVNSIPNSSLVTLKSDVETSGLHVELVEFTTKAHSQQTITADPQNLTEISVTFNMNESLKQSEEKDTAEIASIKEPKKIRRRKRAIAKVESVEISNEVAEPTAHLTEAAISNADEKDLCIVFHSQPSNAENSVSNPQSEPSVPATTVSSEKVALNDVLPVEKVAEEMEKLILQQLEEEERAKEISLKNQAINPFGSPDHNLTAPSKLCEPPKEKPPPPPSTENEVQKPTSLKRVNSTKRIKKEIHKRRSNFLGIDDADESIVSAECRMQPPPAMEQILKAEMELDRESRRRLESEADLRLKLEECEMMEKEREIIASLFTEEQRRTDLGYDGDLLDALQEEARIQKLKVERKQAENEKAEAQRLRLVEEQQLRDREEYIRKQEVGIETSSETSAPVLSGAANLSNSAKPNAFLLCTEANSVSGNSVEKGLCVSLSAPAALLCAPAESKSPRPAVPPKPLKKKEAIRKERERLRQEQEVLQREREEHRQRLLREQEEVLNSKSPPVPHGTSSIRALLTLTVALTAIPLSLWYLGCT